MTEAFDARWTDKIQDEWTRALLTNASHVDAARIARTRRLMDNYVPTGLVSESEHRIANITLPDADDRHVAAAAIQCNAKFIVTKNLKDFPAAVLTPLGVETVHPDAFVRLLLDLNPTAALDAVRRHRADLQNPPRSPAEYIAALEAQDMPTTAASLRGHSGPP